MRKTLVPILALLMLVPAGVADATFPGRNGKLAIRTERCGGETQTQIRGYSLAGRDLGPIVPCRPDGPEDEPGPDVYAPDWSADGSRLLFGEGYEQKLATVAADGGDYREIPFTTPDEYAEPYHGMSLAPDGRHLAVSRGHNLYTLALDGNEVKRLREHTKCKDAGYCVWYHQPRWSPDGRRIAAVVGSASPRVIRPGIWIFDAQTGAKVRRISSRGTEPDWSPDGRRLLFRSDYQQREIRGGASGGNIFVARANGKGDPRRVVHRENIAEIQPVWAPNGLSFAWVSLRFGAGDVSFSVKPSLWRKRLGGKARRIVNLPQPYVEEGFWTHPDLAWQPLPR
jgi:Tol biopolymer transport system component